MENKYKHVIDLAIVKLYERYPELDEKYGEAGREKCYEDNIHHFNYLDSAVEVKEEKVFVDYAIWLNSVLVSRGMKSDHLIDNFNCMIEALEESPNEYNKDLQTYLLAGIKSIK